MLVISAVILAIEKSSPPKFLPDFSPFLAWTSGILTLILGFLVVNERLPIVPGVMIIESPAAVSLTRLLLLVVGIIFALSLIPLLWRSRIAAAVTAGILVNLAAIFKRILIVVPSLTHGSLLPYGVGKYTPTWVEYSVILGLAALGVLLYALFMKVFPIIELAPEGGE